MKALNATCSAAGVVTSEGVTVPAADVLSEGTKASSGVLILDEDRPKYITSNASDIKKLIEDAAGVFQQIIVVLTGLDAVSTSPGSVTAAITALTTLKTQFEATKETLK